MILIFSVPRNAFITRYRISATNFLDIIIMGSEEMMENMRENIPKFSLKKISFSLLLMEISGYRRLLINLHSDGTLRAATASAPGFYCRIKNQKRNFMSSIRIMIIKKTWQEMKAAN